MLHCTAVPVLPLLLVCVCLFIFSQAAYHRQVRLPRLDRRDSDASAGIGGLDEAPTANNDRIGKDEYHGIQSAGLPGIEHLQARFFLQQPLRGYVLSMDIGSQYIIDVHDIEAVIPRRDDADLAGRMAYSGHSLQLRRLSLFAQFDVSCMQRTSYCCININSIRFRSNSDSV